MDKLLRTINCTFRANQRGNTDGCAGNRGRKLERAFNHLDGNVEDAASRIHPRGDSNLLDLGGLENKYTFAL